VLDPQNPWSSFKTPAQSAAARIEVNAHAWRYDSARVVRIWGNCASQSWEYCVGRPATGSEFAFFLLGRDTAEFGVGCAVKDSHPSLEGIPCQGRYRSLGSCYAWWGETLHSIDPLSRSPSDFLTALTLDRKLGEVMVLSLAMDHSAGRP
jgi:hypothetical protein